MALFVGRVAPEVQDLAEEGAQRHDAADDEAEAV
jgi:hypothetical protein